MRNRKLVLWVRIRKIINSARDARQHEKTRIRTARASIWGHAAWTQRSLSADSKNSCRNPKINPHSQGGGGRGGGTNFRLRIAHYQGQHAAQRDTSHLTPHAMGRNSWLNSGRRGCQPQTAGGLITRIPPPHPQPQAAPEVPPSRTRSSTPHPVDRRPQV